jgi:hypothetical protein
MRRPLALALLFLSTACAHRATAPGAVSQAAAQAHAAQAAQLQASAHERRHDAINMLESMLGIPPLPTPPIGSPGH